eukprot:447558-Pelagomonas_calceolata.AAC.7
MLQGMQKETETARRMSGQERPAQPCLASFFKHLQQQQERKKATKVSAVERISRVPERQNK